LTERVDHVVRETGNTPDGGTVLKRWAIAGAAAAALVAGTGLAASRANNPNALGPFFLGPKMARAEVIMVYGGAVHDWRLDQGRVVGVLPDALKLAERDGTRTVVPVSQLASVTVNNKLAAMTDITRGMTALTARDGNAPATIVRVTGRKGASP
jgi:hypothetical protein